MLQPKFFQGLLINFVILLIDFKWDKGNRLFFSANLPRSFRGNSKNTA